MTYQLPAREELLAPDYWDGIDIEARSETTVLPDPSPQLTNAERRLAAATLRDCLGEILTGEYTETRTSIRPTFDPTAHRLADGGVIVLEKEHLMKWVYSRETEVFADWDNPELSNDSPPIETPFAEYWKRNQHLGAGERRHFGAEEAVFSDRHIMYGRYLQWGVLQTRKDGSRLLATWAFCAPRVTSDGIFIPEDSLKLPGEAEALPIEINQAQVRSDYDLEGITYRTIERNRDIRVIFPVSAGREKVPSLSERVKAWAADVGKIVVPRPTVVPG